MHCPSVEPRRSLYFDYQVYPAFTAGVGAAAIRREALVVVGAGPIGLTAALELTRYGIPSVVLEAEQQVSEGSRAIVFTRRSLEILQQVGVADRERCCTGCGSTSGIGTSLTLLLAERLSGLYPELTLRDRELLRLLLTGVDNDDIAVSFGIRPSSAATYIKRLYRKLGTGGLRELIGLATQGQWR